MNRNDYVLIDGEIRSASEFEALIHSEEAYAYEVIRVIDGKPVFLEEHLERLGRTLAGVGEKYTVDTEELRDGIARLLAANGVRSDNVKMILSGGSICVIINGASYPTNRMYNEGVRVGILEAERINPQAKISNHSLRATADRLLTDEGCFEVLLQDRCGCITEGSRSNVFFIKNCVYKIICNLFFIFSICYLLIINNISTSYFLKIFNRNTVWFFFIMISILNDTYKT